MAIYTDAMDDVEHTLLTSHTTSVTWTLAWNISAAQSWEIQSNRLQTGNTGGTYINSATPSSADYSHEADFIFPSSVGGGDYFGVGVRVSDDGHNGYFILYDIQGARWQLYKLVSGTFGQLGGNVSQVLTIGQAYRGKVAVTGSSITASVDGTSIIGPITNADITATGKCGIYGSIASNNGVGLYLDNFSATDAGGVSVTTTSPSWQLVGSQVSGSPSDTTVASGYRPGWR